MIGLGGLVLVGWHTGLEALIQGRPGFAAMQYLMALCFLIAGVGLFALQVGTRRAALLCGGAVGLVGAMLCREYLFGLKLGFDPFLAHLPATPTLRTIRPSPPMVGRVTPAVFHDPGEVERRGCELSRELGRPVEGFEVFVALPRRDGSERREWTYLCKDGSRKTVELTVTVLHDGTGEISGFLGTAIDISERSRTDRAPRALATAPRRQRAEMAEAEMDAYLSKPVRAATLAQALREAFAARNPAISA